jgi:hypothetical protein
MKHLTAESWRADDFPYSNYDGPLVLKGTTNSFKGQWNELMFAKDRKDALEKSSKLNQHHIIQQQGLIYRKYIPLKEYHKSYNGLPITNEWRFFFLNDKRLAYGYYWKGLSEDWVQGEMTNEGLDFAQQCANIAKDHINFFVVDIAEKEDGEWVMIELNDGCMSGLSSIDSSILYSNLKKSL